MSHADRCPDRWTAAREGERAQEHGYGRFRNPYDDPFSRDRCEDAAEAWNSGYRRAERQQEEREEEARYAARQAERRAQERAEEEAYYEQAYAYEPPPPYDIRDECASHGHEEYTQAVDRFGRRCYCGLVRYLDLVHGGPTAEREKGSSRSC